MQYSPFAVAHATLEFHLAEFRLTILTAAPFAFAPLPDALIGAAVLGQIDIQKRARPDVKMDGRVETHMGAHRDMRAGADVEIIRQRHSRSQRCDQESCGYGNEELSNHNDLLPSIAEYLLVAGKARQVHGNGSAGETARLAGLDYDSAY